MSSLRQHAENPIWEDCSRGAAVSLQGLWENVSGIRKYAMGTVSEGSGGLETIRGMSSEREYFAQQREGMRNICADGVSVEAYHSWNSG